MLSPQLGELALGGPCRRLCFCQLGAQRIDLCVPARFGGAQGIRGAKKSKRRKWARAYLVQALPAVVLGQRRLLLGPVDVRPQLLHDDRLPLQVGLQLRLRPFQRRDRLFRLGQALWVCTRAGATRGVSSRGKVIAATGYDADLGVGAALDARALGSVQGGEPGRVEGLDLGNRVLQLGLARSELRWEATQSKTTRGRECERGRGCG